MKTNIRYSYILISSALLYGLDQISAPFDGQFLGIKIINSKMRLGFKNEKEKKIIAEFLRQPPTGYV